MGMFLIDPWCEALFLAHQEAQEKTSQASRTEPKFSYFPVFDSYVNVCAAPSSGIGFAKGTMSITERNVHGEHESPQWKGGHWNSVSVLYPFFPTKCRIPTQNSATGRISFGDAGGLDFGCSQLIFSGGEGGN